MAGVTQDPEAWARLGAKIRERRESLNMSRRQLSAVAGVSEKSIQVAEEGRTPRARWPQSLRLIEHALRWDSESMQRILEGGEPDELLDLFSLEQEEDAVARLRGQAPLFPAETTEEALPLEIDTSPSNHARSKALAALPKSFRAALAEILPFGTKARSYGADPEIVEQYEHAVELLLLDLLKRLPLSWEGTRDPGHLAMWNTAMRMDPVLRKEKEELLRAQVRERRMLEETEHLYRLNRDVVVGGTTSADVLRELRRLAEEVAVISEKVNAQGSVPGVDRSFTDEEMEQQPKPRDA